MLTRREFLRSIIAVPFLPAVFRRLEEPPRPVTLFEAYVAGYRFYDGDSVIEELRVGSRLHLRRQPSNPYDSKAIEILTDDGVKLGYVPMRLNPLPASLLDSGERVTAEIVELDLGAVPWERVRFALKVKEKDIRLI